MRIFDKISYILLYLLGFAIIGLASLIDPDLGFKPLMDQWKHKIHGDK